MAGSGEGMVFPAEEGGARSTTRAATRIVAAALHELDPRLGDAARRERRWRDNYPAHFGALVRHGLPSAERAIASSRAGLRRPGRRSSGRMPTAAGSPAWGEGTPGRRWRR